MNERLMDFNETKKYLKTSRATFYRLLQANKIPASKIGRQWRFKKARLDEWLSENENMNIR